MKLVEKLATMLTLLMAVVGVVASIFMMFTAQFFIISWGILFLAGLILFSGLSEWYQEYRERKLEILLEAVAILQDARDMIASSDLKVICQAITRAMREKGYNDEDISNVLNGRRYPWTPFFREIEALTKARNGHFSFPINEEGKFARLDFLTKWIIEIQEKIWEL